MKLKICMAPDMTPYIQLNGENISRELWNVLSNNLYPLNITDEQRKEFERLKLKIQ